MPKVEDMTLTRNFPLNVVVGHCTGHNDLKHILLGLSYLSSPTGLPDYQDNVI